MTEKAKPVMLQKSLVSVDLYIFKLLHQIKINNLFICYMKIVSFKNVIYNVKGSVQNNLYSELKRNILRYVWFIFKNSAAVVLSTTLSWQASTTQSLDVTSAAGVPVVFTDSTYSPATQIRSFKQDIQND